MAEPDEDLIPFRYPQSGGPGHSLPVRPMILTDIYGL
jgi:hypothetical protein